MERVIPRFVHRDSDKNVLFQLIVILLVIKLLKKVKLLRNKIIIVFVIIDNRGLPEKIACIYLINKI